MEQGLLLIRIAEIFKVGTKNYFQLTRSATSLNIIGGEYDGLNWILTAHYNSYLHSRTFCTISRISCRVFYSYVYYDC